MLDAMKAELARSMAHFKSQKMPPFFLSYEVTETETAGVNGSFGALVSGFGLPTDCPLAATDWGERAATPATRATVSSTAAAILVPLTRNLALVTTVAS